MLAAAVLLAAPWEALAATDDAQQDFSNLSWSESFDATVDLLAVRYALTEHKGIDWARVRAEFRPAIAAAQAAGDPAAAYVAWRTFVHRTIHDGHVFFGPMDPESPAGGLAAEVEAQHVGGDFGLEVARCDDGSVLVVRADAAVAGLGLTPGARLIAWNGQPIAEALAATDLVWAPVFASTEMLPVIQERTLVHAPVGAAVAVRFVPAGAGAGESREATLVARPVAEPDGLGFATSAYCRVVPKPAGDFGADLRSDGVGVLTLPTMMPTVAEDAGPEELLAAAMAIVDGVHAAVAQFGDRGARGVIVDLRNNTGGFDALGALIAASFYPQRQHYTTAVGYESATRRWTTRPSEEPLENPLYIRPLNAPFPGRIAVLVNPCTVSAGEGLAYRLGRLPGATVVGFFGSNGSFGNTGGGIHVGGGFGLAFPIERCVDEQGAVMIDTDGEGRGGVIPQVRVPRTPATLRALFTEGRDVEMETAAALLLAASGDQAIPAVTPARVQAAPGLRAELRAPAGAVGYQWFEGGRGDTSRPVAGGTAATLGVLVGSETEYWVRLYRAVGAVDSVAVPVAPALAGAELLPPSGRCAVGTVELPLVDTARSGRYSDGSTSTGREMMVRFWYPAMPTSDAATTEYMDATTFGYYTAADGVDPAMRLAIGTHAVANAPMPAGTGRFPVLLFAPGATGSYLGYQNLLEDLASQGFVVAAVNSPDVAGITVFPDGHSRAFRLPAEVDGAYFERMMRVAADDLRFVVRALARLDRDRTLPFAGRLQASTIGCFGHSLGGAAAIQAAVENPQIVAAMNLDGSFWGDGYRRPLLKPMAMLRADDTEGTGYDEGIATFWSNLRKGGFRITLLDANHDSFTDWPHLAWLSAQLDGAADPAAAPARSLQTTRAAVVGFFDPLLRDPAAPGLAARLADRPDAVLEQRTVRPVAR